jgi:hypothetical protein
MTNEQDLPDDQPLELVAVAGPTEAQMIEELLRNNGIQSSLQGNVSSMPLPTVSDLDEIRIFVKPADFARAQELVDGYFTPVGKDELVEDQAELGVEDPDEPGGFTS